MAKASQYKPQFATPINDEIEDVEDTPNLPALNHQADGEDAFDTIGSMLDELREGGEYAELSVYGRPKQQPGQPAQRGNAFLMVCGASDYTLAELMALIQESWGEGLYTIKGKRGGKYAGQKTIPIGPAPNKPGQIAAPVATDPMKPMAEFLEKMLRQQTETMAAMLGSVLTKLDRPVVDPMTVQRDTLALLGSMRDVFAPTPVVQTASPTSSFSQLKELLEIKKLLSKEDTGSDENENPLMDMAKQFLPALMASANQQPAIPAQQQAQLSKPVQLKTPAVKQTIVESPAMLELIQGLKMLVDAAKRDPNFENVELYAELIVEKFSLDKIKTFITAPDSLDRLAMFSKDVTIYRKWFEKVRGTLIEWIKEAESDTTPGTAEEHNDSTTDGDTPG